MEDSTQQPKVEIMTNQTSNTAASATNKFGLALFKEEARQNKGKNVLVSPASVAIALAMTMNGARSTTLAAMQSTLGFSENESLETINASMAALLAALTDPSSGVELNVANAIWAEQSMTFKPDFLNRVVAAYQATINNADFGDAGTVDAINAWADEKTKGKIPTIIKSISPDMVMFLLNAIYFKGKWSEAFDKSMTYSRAFNSEEGEVSAMFMNREAELRYVGNKSYQAVALPFGASGRVVLYVVLPAEGAKIDDFVQNFDGAVFAALKQAYKSEVELSLPRFQVEFDTDLKASLGKLGMSEALSAGADLSGLADASMYISQVKHKTFARFDEDGGEAAAVTAVGVALECVRMVPRIDVDRPFVAALVDETTDTLLFIGKVSTPE